MRPILSALLLAGSVLAQAGQSYGETLVTWPLAQVLDILPAPNPDHSTVLLRTGSTWTASTSMLQLNIARSELRISTASGDGGWTNLPNSVGGSKRESIVAPVIYTSEWQSGNPRTTHRVTTNCDTYQDLRVCAEMHRRAVAAMQAVYPPA